jgi:hypothetical protein
VIDGKGLAVGLVSRQPISGETAGAGFFAQYDNLGYGVAIPSDEIVEFVTSCQAGDGDTVQFIRESDIPYREFPE